MQDKREARVHTIGDLLDALAAHKEVWLESTALPNDDWRHVELLVGIDLSRPTGEFLPLENVCLLDASEDGDSFALVGDWPDRGES